MKISELEITNFDLTYDGMYFISWEDNYKKRRKIRIFLQLSTILKMVEIEGLSYEDVKTPHYYEPIHFRKVTLTVPIIEEDNKDISFYTSPSSEIYYALTNGNISMIDAEVKR